MYSFVWMRIFPILISLTTDSSAGSIVSPARRIETPHNCRGTGQKNPSINREELVYEMVYNLVFNTMCDRNEFKNTIVKSNIGRQRATCIKANACKYSALTTLLKGWITLSSG